MSRHSLILMVFLASLAPATAGAADVDARAVTLLGGRPDVRDGVIYTTVPIYELLSLNARRLEAPGFDDLRVVLSLWGRLDPGDPADGDLADGDIDLGYAEGTLGKGALRLRLGRQIVFAGGSRGAGLDGAMAETHFGLFGLSLYGGVPVTPRFGVDRGDALWGARASLRASVDAEIGISYTHSLDNGRLSRLDFGVDGRWVLSRKLTLTGLGLLSAAEMRLAEARLTAGWQPDRRVHVDALVAQSAPDLFLSRASILSVFAETSRTEAGAAATWRPLDELRLRGGYFVLGNEDGIGHRGEIAGEYRVTPDAGVGAEAGALQIPDDGYLHFRLYGRTLLVRRLWGTAEGDLYRLNEERNGTNLSARGAASLRWDPGRRWYASLTGVVGSDPLYETRWEVMAKLALAFDKGGVR